MAIVQSAGDLTTELACLLLLQLAVGYDVVKHLPAVDELKEHIPMIVGSYNISQTADVRMIEERPNGSLPSSPNLLGLIGSLLICAIMMAVIHGSPWDDLASYL